MMTDDAVNEAETAPKIDTKSAQSVADAFTPPRMADRYFKPDSVHLYEAIQWNGDMTVWVPWSARISSLRVEGNPGARPDTLILEFRGGGFNPDTVRLKIGDWAVCTGIGHYSYTRDEFKAFAPAAALAGVYPPGRR